MVVEGPSDISAENVIRLVDAVRGCVGQALDYDELGIPAVSIPNQASEPRKAAFEKAA